MNIDTTINITDKNLSLLNEYSNLLNINRNELIIKLINKFIIHEMENFEFFRRVRYQKKKENETWKMIHLWLNTDLYEKCLDLRKFHKLSLSYIICKAIELYLFFLLEEDFESGSNNYIFLSSMYNDCPFFVTGWNIPDANNLLKVWDTFYN